MVNDILHFWFEEIDSKSWWVKDQGFDELVANRFGHILEQAAQCELWHWRDTPQGRLAEVIVLDQFSRNIYRNQAKAFAADALALGLAQEAVANKSDELLQETERSFLYMPYMHSESVHIHEHALKLFAKLQSSASYEFELKHKAIIDRFGRYPHRNNILSRESTEAEIEFLAQADSSF